MTINVAINGYGRIGRMVLRALYEDQVMASLGEILRSLRLMRWVILQLMPT